MSDTMLNGIKEILQDDEIRNSPFEQISILDIMNKTVEEFKSILLPECEKVHCTENEIHELCDNVYKAIYSKLYEEEEEEDDNDFEDDFEDENDSLPGLSNHDIKVYQREVVSTFYKFCFDAEIAQRILSKRLSSADLARKMAITKTAENSVAINLFREFAEKHNISIDFNDYPQQWHITFGFNLVVERLIIDNDNHYIELLVNDFEKIDIDSDSPIAIANNFIIYVKDGKPTSIYIAVKGIISDSFALRKVSSDGSSYNVGFVKNNERVTLLEKILTNEN